MYKLNLLFSVLWSISISFTTNIHAKTISSSFNQPDFSVNRKIVNTNPRWKILVLIYASTDFTYTDEYSQLHRVVTSMTEDENWRATTAAMFFFSTDVSVLTSGNMQPLLTFRYPTRTLTYLEPACGYWPSQVSTATELDPEFDSVVVIWDSSGTDLITGQPADLQNCGGLAIQNGIFQTYAAIQVDSVESNNRNVFKHEWGHSILFFFDALGVTPKPTVDNHINNTSNRYVHCPTGEPYILQDETDENPIPNSIYNNVSGFTHDYYSGTTAKPDQPSICLGITSSAWASDPPSVWWWVFNNLPKIYLPIVRK